MKRCIKPRGIDKTVYISFQSFSDASELGYGKSRYLRLVDEDRYILCTLMMAKARITPKRFVSIPLLELVTTVLAVKISALIKKELDTEELTEYFWTDSKLVLGYIAKNSKNLQKLAETFSSKSKSNR